MSFLEPEPGKTDESAAELAMGVRLIPRITIQAFCEHSQTAQLIESALQDRRMSKVALTTHNGGVEGAIETYRANPTPNLIIIETTLAPDEIANALGRLAEVCDAATQLVVLGHVNDVVLYRELKRSGVADYLILPTTPQAIVEAIAEIFVSENSRPIGRSIGFIGAKGGAGASTVCHNVAWAVSQALRQNVLILDMDLPFGTAGLNFNQDPPNGLADAITAGDKIDQTLLDRLMSKATSHINLLTAPATLDTPYDLEPNAFEQIIEISQKTTPIVILDIPVGWSGWIRQTLATIDEIVIVAEPDLANLRNAKNLADTLKALRPAETPPLLVINQFGMPRRPEISPSEFAASIECRLLGTIGFDAALFGTAANNGQMIAEVSAGNRANEVYRQIGLHVTGRNPAERNARTANLKLPAFLKRKRA